MNRNTPFCIMEGSIQRICKGSQNPELTEIASSPPPKQYKDANTKLYTFPQHYKDHIRIRAENSAILHSEDANIKKTDYRNECFQVNGNPQSRLAA